MAARRRAVGRRCRTRRRQGRRRHIVVRGRAAAYLVFATLDEDRQPSQEYRTLFLRQLLAGGVLAPSFVDVGRSHRPRHRADSRRGARCAADVPARDRARIRRRSSQRPPGCSGTPPVRRTAPDRGRGHRGAGVCGRVSVTGRRSSTGLPARGILVDLGQEIGKRQTAPGRASPRSVPPATRSECRSQASACPVWRARHRRRPPAIANRYPARLNRATARDAAPYARTERPAAACR